MSFKEVYTTADKISSQSTMKPEEQTEKTKLVVSNDSFLQAEMLEQLNTALTALFYKV
jgi:hypothetical protein